MPAVSTSAKENRRGNTVGPNRDRLTVGVDLGDRWSQYCILGLEGETLAEGQLRTTQEDVGGFFRDWTGGGEWMEEGINWLGGRGVLPGGGQRWWWPNRRWREG